MGKARKARADAGWCAERDFSLAFNSSSPRHFGIRTSCWWSYNSIYRLTTQSIFQGEGWVLNLLNVNLFHGLPIFPGLESTLQKLQVSDEMWVQGAENSSWVSEMEHATVWSIFPPLFLASIALTLKWSWFSWGWGNSSNIKLKWLSAFWLIHADFCCFQNKYHRQSLSPVLAKWKLFSPKTCPVLWLRGHCG